MENYNLGQNAVLSTVDGETTDNLIASAIGKLPNSAVSAIMPVIKTKGPTSQWVEPYYHKDKLEMVSTPVSMFDDQTQNERKSLKISCNAVEDLMRMYRPESYNAIIQQWITFHKNTQQRDNLVRVLQSNEVSGNQADFDVQGIQDQNEDVFEILQDRISRCMTQIKKDYQLSDVQFSVVGPYSITYSIKRLENWFKVKINAMYDDRLDRVYVFPSGNSSADRAGLTLFEYADEYQKSNDFDTGDTVYWIYNRSSIVVNPCHAKTPIIRSIQL